MTTQTPHPLVHRPETGLTGPGQRTSPILDRMTQDLVARAEGGGLSLARFRLGDYLLREPDYLQILSWAKSLGMKPRALLAVLADSQLESNSLQSSAPIGFVVKDGAIVSLAWDFARLPIIPADWVPGLLVHSLGFRGKWPDADRDLRPVLPRLQTLVCCELDLAWLDLSQVPELGYLDCSQNKLTDLDLTPVPKLSGLNCRKNQLTELDFSPVPGLIKLDCKSNQLTKLNLSPVTGLTELCCAFNQLTELDLSPVRGLIGLYCTNNQLSKLDLTAVTGLTELFCASNQLTKLDLTPVPKLTRVDCGENKLTRLDLNAINLSLSGSACSSRGNPGVLRVSSCAEMSGSV